MHFAMRAKYLGQQLQILEEELDDLRRQAQAENDSDVMQTIAEGTVIHRKAVEHLTNGNYAAAKYGYWYAEGYVAHALSELKQSAELKRAMDDFFSRLPPP